MSKRIRDCNGNDYATKRKANGSPQAIKLSHNAYTVGWVCALQKEQTAAMAMLDQIHADLPKPVTDQNTYTLGSIGRHNIVIACLPTYGSTSASVVAIRMVATFPSLKVGLMVGIGGGIPPMVRLGDVVVSVPENEHPGVIQWDMGKEEAGGRFRRTGSLNSPPSSLLTALRKLGSKHEMSGTEIPDILEELKQKWPRLAPKYLRSPSLEDVLFKARYTHTNVSSAECNATVALCSPEMQEDNMILDAGEGDEERDEEEIGCRFCDKRQTLKRKPRDMRVHNGLIASGNKVIKDATFRDRLNQDLGGHVLCIETEAAGLMNGFPCLVIRGICDYCDSHKNNHWQEHAAAVAAAFAKELLEQMQPDDVAQEPPAKDMLNEG